MIRSKQDDTTTTSRLLVECLENEGVQYIFGIPGEENLELMSELKDSKIKFITTRHEQGAAFMADVYGRLTGHAGVCLATLGPGATNLATGVADANGDGAPLIAITGQVGTERMHITSHQYMDLTKFFEPITKRTKMVVRPDTINEIVRIAFKYAESERPGACHIDIPVNISKMKFSASERPLKRELPLKEKAVDRSISEAAKLISQASNPIILAGSQAIRVHASKALTRFAEDLKIPVVNTMMAKGIIPYDNKYAMMTVGIPQYDHANKLLVDADLIVAIGYDLVEFSPFRWNQDNNAKIVHISTTPAHINKYYQCDVEVIGDISDALNRIVDELNGENRNEPENVLKIRKAFDESFEKDAKNDNFPMTPHRIINDVRKALGRKDILISDVGAHKMWIARLYHCYEPNTCIISNGFATMGIGLPGAVSAKLVHPERRILTVTGDGGFMMNSQELETAVRLKLNIVVLIMNDSSYGLIKWKQMDQYGETYFTDFTNPDFVKLAESMNCIGYRVTKASDLSELLEKAFHQDRPVIIDVPADYSENVKLSQKLKKWREKLVSNRMHPAENK
ncbi:MAG: acetolactate synthase large subunit [Firmicutes bacterium]|nr:acetolactate synthase large subunit [Bacillota bacterium]